MNVAHLLPLVPEIERQIEHHRLDCLVLGLGPSGWLAPWIDSSVLHSMRLWGAHDIHRILPVDDLVLMDSPSRTGRLKPGTDALDALVKSRPKRLWLNDWWTDEWDRYLHFSVRSICQPVTFWVWTHPQKCKGQEIPKQWCFNWPTPHCGLISPLACATLAWREGARRIGVLGVDCGPEHPQTHQHIRALDSIFCQLANDAHAQGGCLVNLSPVTYLQKFSTWTPSASSSVPSPASESTTPSESSSTASESTSPGLSTSTGCEPEIPAGKPASAGQTDPGASARQCMADGLRRLAAGEPGSQGSDGRSLSSAASKGMPST